MPPRLFELFHQGSARGMVCSDLHQLESTRNYLDNKISRNSEKAMGYDERTRSKHLNEHFLASHASSAVRVSKMQFLLPRTSAMCIERKAQVVARRGSSADR